MRGQSLTVREETFIEASHAIGTSRRRVIWRHVLPNILGPLSVQASIVFGFVLLIEAGAQLPRPRRAAADRELGVMLQRARTASSSATRGAIIPAGLAIAVTVFCFNAVGDGLRAALGGAKTRGAGRSV